MTLKCLIGRAAGLSIALALMSWAPMAHAETADAPHEAVVWSASYRGEIAGKAVKLELWRLDGAVGGSYCYEPCNRPGATLDLEGSASGQLTETPMAGASDPKPSGRWSLAALPGMAPPRLQGQWQSADGKKRWPVNLLRQPPDFSHAVHYELRLLMDQKLRSLADCGEHTDLLVSAIQVYEQGRLKQSLPTAAVGSCWLVQPRWVDANFDGWPDLTQALDLPAGPNIAHRTWIYDPGTQKLVLGPQSLQDISSPAFDGKARRIYSEWRASCCSHGVNIYAWKPAGLELVEQAESYMLPVRKGGKLMACYQVPDYAQGHVRWPAGLYQRGGELSLGQEPAADWCDADPAASMGQNQVTVLAEPRPGQPPQILKAYGASYRKVDTPKGARYCPDIAVFDADAHKVVRVLMSENAEQNCETENPAGGQP